MYVSSTDCGAQADIVFLLDESGSVGRDNYKKMLAFVNQIADDFSIGPHDVQIGLETFSSTTRHQFDMNKYADKTALKAAITKTPYHGGNTHTGDALAYLSSHSFTKAAGMRDNVPHIAFVLTDGNSQQRTLTKTNGAKLQGQGVKVMAIGIGNGINNQELDNIASNPDSQYVFRAANFDALKNLKAILASKACEGEVHSKQNYSEHVSFTISRLVMFNLNKSGPQRYFKFDFLKSSNSKFQIQVLPSNGYVSRIDHGKRYATFGVRFSFALQ